MDKLVLDYPTNYISVDSLAQRVLRDFSSPKEQVRAFYTWLISNISYDVPKANLGGDDLRIFYLFQKDSLKRTHAVLGAYAQLTLEEKKGVCSNYTYLFHQLCSLAGIEAHYIVGYAKYGVMELKAKPESPMHTWNAVKINGEWYFIDTTWGAGHIENQQFIKQNTYDYFLVPPHEFALDHYPMLQKWHINLTVIDYDY